MDDNNQGLELAEMLNSLRTELKKSQQNAEGETIAFQVENIDLEFKINIEKTEEGNGSLGVKFWVVNAGIGGKGSDKHSTTQTIKLSLKAKDLTDLDEDDQPRDASVRG